MDDLEQLHATRARLVAELLGARRQLERALHDGVQQDLTALAVELQLAAASAPEPVTARLGALRDDVHTTLDAVQRLAERLYPPLLDAGGLGAALPGIARRAGIRLHLRAAEGLRASPDAEAAVLFACLAVFEAAPQGEVVAVSLREDAGRLRVELEPADVAVLPLLARDLVEGVGGTVETTGPLVLTV